MSWQLLTWNVTLRVSQQDAQDLCDHLTQEAEEFLSKMQTYVIDHPEPPKVNPNVTPSEYQDPRAAEAWFDDIDRQLRLLSSAMWDPWPVKYLWHRLYSPDEPAPTYRCEMLDENQSALQVRANIMDDVESWRRQAVGNQ